MEYYIHPDVKTLKVIADNWWHQPKLNSLSTSSWAVQDPYSNAVTDFVKFYRKAQATDLGSMSDAQVEEELRHFQAEIDDLFFFSLLTRKVEGKSGVNRLVTVQVMDDLPRGSYCGAYKQDATSPRIMIWRENDRGEPQCFEHLIYTLVHEMCHAYLDLFGDKRHPKSHKWVYDYQGHGEMFWVLLRFVAGKIGVYTQSKQWQRELSGMENECYELTQTSGEPGSWGTPERTLMGGFLGP